ncbi:hypothetical protein FACS189444_4100 [Spirochaetia bacterium]|nr:hypothetical protein FACS189444_4100 [Spirochaetia bacterium]
MPKTDEENLAECQREIRRLRSAVREYEDRYSGIDILKVRASASVSGHLIGDVATEMWNKALDLKAQELSFEFNNHVITIRNLE